MCKFLVRMCKVMQNVIASNFITYSNDVRSVFIFLTALFIFLTNAVEVTDEDIDSPLVSYLLAKLQQLESKIMVKPNSRTTREVTQRSTKPPIVADNKKCSCQPGVVTYVRWGNSSCPYGADIIYSGVVAGSWYDYQGAAVDPLCLLPNPQYLQAGYQSFHVLFGAEYKTHAESPLNHINSLCTLPGLWTY